MGKNYKVGWLIHNKLAALTHYHANITEDDIKGVIADADELIQGISSPISIIIDNRKAPLSKIFSLEQLRAMSPFLNNTMLRWIIIIKPEHLSIKNNTEIEHSDMIRLKNVSTIEEAVLFMNENHITDEPIDLSFFP